MKHEVAGALSTVLTAGVGFWAVAVLPVVPVVRRILFFILGAISLAAFSSFF